ncbi:MAG: hypothetical protein JST55_14520 [Bacteroidetes bacterium]|nr:hypothetical protein [Bacteroidota bacterium]
MFELIIVIIVTIIGAFLTVFVNKKEKQAIREDLRDNFFYPKSLSPAQEKVRLEQIQKKEEQEKSNGKSISY